MKKPTKAMLLKMRAFFRPRHKECETQAAGGKSRSRRGAQGQEWLGLHEVTASTCHALGAGGSAVTTYSYTRTEFIVEGTGPFPVDMLRYDRAVPALSADADEIERSYVNPRGPARRIKLLKFTPRGGIPLPTRGRWESFGWRVVE